MFQPVLFSLIKKYKKQFFIADLGAGLIVGIVALPLAIAFSIASGVPPETGLITAVVVGFLVSFFGGSRVQIGGPSGALIVVIYGTMQQFGFEGVVIASIMAGMLLIIMGLLRAGTIIQFMPYPIVVGFTSGIALIIFTGQIQDFLGIAAPGAPAEPLDKWIYYARNLSEINAVAAFIGLLTMLITLFWHNVYKKIPGSLVGIITATLLTLVFNLELETIGSRFGTFSASFALPGFSNVSFELIQQLFVPAFTIAALIAIESLLSAIVADGATGYRHRPNTELMAQGIANICAPLLGGMAGSGALAKTMTNIRNGGKTPLAGIIHAIVILLFMLFLGKLAMYIPLTALAGVLIVVAYNMSEWRSFRSILKSSRGEIAVLLTTFLLTIFIGLNFALPFGIILAMILFVNRVMETTDIEILRHEVEDERSHVSDEFETLEIPKGVEVFQIKGPFFFGIVNKFEEAEKEIHELPRVRIIRMRRVPFIDSTGLKNLRSFVQRSRNHHTEIILSGVTPKALQVLRKDGLHCEIGRKNICNTIEEALERSREILKGDS
ncbi:MAG: SulP family inorganic anion transporter [Bacteroidales bacterium]|nr:SulP family inorganic anion transporter [Bacteroidales bacterium]